MADYNIGALIAGTGGITPPKFDFQSAIGDLPKAYWEGLNQRNIQQQRDAFKSGLPRVGGGQDGPIDWNAVANIAATTGGLGQMQNIVGLLGHQTDSEIAGRPVAPLPGEPTGTPSLSTPQPSPIRGNVGPIRNDNMEVPPRTVAQVNSAPQPAPSPPQLQPTPEISPPGALTRDHLLARAYELRAQDLFSKADAYARNGNKVAAENATKQAQEASGKAKDTYALINKNKELTPDEKNARASGSPSPAAYAADKAFNEGEGKSYADLNKELTANSRKAYNSLGTFDVMQAAIKNPKFYSGFGGEQVLQLRRAMVALGGDPSVVKDMETFRSEANRSVYASLGSLGTGVSEGDRRFIVDIFPSLTNTPQGNAQIIAVGRSIAERQIEVGRRATQYVKAHGKLDSGFDAELDAWSAKNPIFNEKKMAEIQGASVSGRKVGERKQFKQGWGVWDGSKYVPEGK